MKRSQLQAKWKASPSKKQKVWTAKQKLPQGASPYQKHKEELKNIDVEEANSITFNQTTANSLALNIIENGTGPSQHVGREVTMKSLYVRWAGHMAPTTTGASSLRCLIVYDKQSNAAAVSPAANAVVVTDEIISMMNLNNNKRFTVLMELEVECLGTQGPQAFSVHKYVKLNHKVEFNQTNGNTIADIQSGAVIAYFWQDGGLLIANPLANVFSRIRYEDA